LVVDVNIISLGCPDVMILVLKAVETITSTVVELDTTDVSRVVKVAVGTRHSTVPDC
jgi:predicted secreted protein